MGREEKQDVSLERALIQMLLGNVDASLELLALDDPQAGDPGVKDFVNSHAGPEVRQMNGVGVF
jgi:hypothetical protein